MQTPSRPGCGAPLHRRSPVRRAGRNHGAEGAIATRAPALRQGKRPRAPTRSNGPSRHLQADCSGGELSNTRYESKDADHVLSLTYRGGALAAREPNRCHRVTVHKERKEGGNMLVPASMRGPRVLLWLTCAAVDNRVHWARMGWTSCSSELAAVRQVHIPYDKESGYVKRRPGASSEDLRRSRICCANPFPLPPIKPGLQLLSAKGLRARASPPHAASMASSHLRVPRSRRHVQTLAPK